MNVEWSSSPILEPDVEGNRIPSVGDNCVSLTHSKPLTLSFSLDGYVHFFMRQEVQLRVAAWLILVRSFLSRSPRGG